MWFFSFNDIKKIYANIISKLNFKENLLNLCTNLSYNRFENMLHDIKASLLHFLKKKLLLIVNQFYLWWGNGGGK